MTAFSAVATVDGDDLTHDGSSSFTGYELMNSLDFDNVGGSPSIWSENCTDGNCLQADGALGPAATKVGWEPIGSGAFVNPTSFISSQYNFSAVFEGNGETISNLYIDRSSADYVGLFGYAGFESVVRNLGIVGGSVTGYDRVGSLAGEADTKIRACYSTVDVTGHNFVGGLVGYSDRGTISACYTTGNVSGSNSQAGGLVGRNRGGTIKACYSTVDVTGNERVGGLVGDNTGGTISACYATGNATGTGSNVGGLVGNNEGTVTNSYFDSTVNSALATTPIGGGTTTGSGITNVSGKTTTELQTPTAYADIYANWNIDVDNGQPIGVDDGTAAGDPGVDDPWDFGTDSEYPALQVDFDRDGTASVVEFGTQPRTAPPAPPAPPATAPDAPVVSSFTPTSGAVSATVMIIGIGFSTTAADNTVTFLGSSSPGDEQTATVNTASATELTVTVPVGAVTGKIQVAVSGEMATSTDDFTVLMSVPPTDTDADGLIDITTLAQLDAIRYDLDGDGRPTSAGQTAWQTAFSAVVAVDDDAAVHDASSSFTGYELMNNLDFAGTKWENPTGGTFAGTHETGGWAPLGYWNSSTDNAYYTATFDGRGHTISNLYINRRTNRVGLFGVLGSGGNVRNLGIEGGSVTGDGLNIGGLVGYNDFGGTISACSATGNASGGGIVGGLVGRSYGTISACYATGDATGTNNVGGLVGYNDFGGTISACYATGDASGVGNVGGLMGENFGGTISACYATGTPSGSSWVGGLVGFNPGGTISACYATGNATGTGDYVGGLVGGNNGTISACYATGDASGDDYVGGLVGYNDSGTISACYATGDATSVSSSVGGLVGSSSGTISACYATGECEWRRFQYWRARGREFWHDYEQLL